MIIKDFSQARLIEYLSTQLANFFPDGRPVRQLIECHLDQALLRLQTCINAVRVWQMDVFDYTHSSQYAIFLYYLANTIWRNEGDEQKICTKLFYLNKALNGIDCFYEIEMPEVFFIGHSVGIVLAKATYGNYLILYQNSTVGKNHGIAPVLGDGVVMYPNTAIIGRSNVESCSVISQGVGVVNKDVPGECLVFQKEGGELVFKKLKRSIHADIFRDFS